MNYRFKGSSSMKYHYQAQKPLKKLVTACMLRARIRGNEYLRSL